MPAPSPLRPSPFSAPLWAMFSSSSSPYSTIRCSFLPSMFTAMPTPHASCS